MLRGEESSAGAANQGATAAAFRRWTEQVLMEQVSAKDRDELRGILEDARNDWTRNEKKLPPSR